MICFAWSLKLGAVFGFGFGFSHLENFQIETMRANK